MEPKKGCVAHCFGAPKPLFKLHYRAIGRRKAHPVLAHLPTWEKVQFCTIRTRVTEGFLDLCTRGGLRKRGLSLYSFFSEFREQCNDAVYFFVWLTKLIIFSKTHVCKIFEDLIRSTLSLEVACRCSPWEVNSIIICCLQFYGLHTWLFAYVVWLNI